MKKWRTKNGRKMSGVIMVMMAFGAAAMAAETTAPVTAEDWHQAVCLANVRLREAPTTDSAQVASMYRGLVVNAVSDADGDGWMKVRIPGGETGYASARYVSVGSAPPLEGSRSLPVLTRIDYQPFDSGDVKALGLTGENKPNGIIYRFRTHRQPGGHWIGPEIPEGIAETTGESMRLNILDRTETGWLAYYRSGVGTGSRDRYLARHYGERFRTQWEVHLDRFLPSDQDREIQDIRLASERLIFNAACASYSEEVDDRCSALIAVDPVTSKELWRTPDLVSNDIFIVEGDWIVCGYGFTSEPDFLYIVDARTGQIAWTAKLDAAHDYLEFNGDRLTVVTYNGVYRFRFAIEKRGPTSEQSPELSK